MSVKNNTACSDLRLLMGWTSINFKNLSIARNKWVKPPGAFHKGLTRSSPHTAKGHVMGMVWRVWVLTVKTLVAFDPQAYGLHVALLHLGVTEDIEPWIGSKLARVLQLTYRSNPTWNVDYIEIIQNERMDGSHKPSHKGKQPKVTLAYHLLVATPAQVTNQSKLLP
jgi:hypothetical protein